MNRLLLLAALLLPVSAHAATQQCFTRFDGALLLSLVSNRVTAVPSPIVSLTGATYFHGDKNIRAVFGAGVQRPDGSWLLNFDSLSPILLDVNLNPINQPLQHPWAVVPCE